MRELPDLHDATLERIGLEWGAGAVECLFRTSHDAVCLRVRGVEEYSCTRQFPWGRSVSVNAVRLVASGSGRELIVEMQSGDLVRIRFLGEWSVDPARPA